MNTTKREQRSPRWERTSRRTAPSGRRGNKSKLVPRFGHDAMQNKAAESESQPAGREANRKVSTQGRNSISHAMVNPLAHFVRSAGWPFFGFRQNHSWTPAPKAIGHAKPDPLARCAMF